MTRALFFDSYAFFEILNGNPAYLPYAQDVAVMTTRLNLMELHYCLLRLHGRKTADAAFRRFLPHCVPIGDDDILEANMFKLENSRRKLSYVDCIGYVISRKHGIRFLTGDRQFKDAEGVEFVK